MLGKKVNALREYMSKALKLSDFRLVITSQETKMGYYSLKKDGDEICLEYDDREGWLVSLCNKWEEVLDEDCFSTQEDALEQANKFYQFFGKLDILYK
jgi:hypothetical protein